MSNLLDKLEREALALSDEERAALAARLVDSLTDDVLSDVDAAWVAEADRRYGEYKQGKRRAIPERGFFTEIREELFG